MSDQKPPDALFIRWGKFQAGAFGRPAILALIALTAAVVLVLWLRLLP
jgi:hypothetical protein